MSARDKFAGLWNVIGGVGGNTTCSKAELREFLRQTGGEPTRNGKICDVRSKHLGAGVYKVWLEDRH